MLLHSLARNWWLLSLRGACAVVFGVLALVWPGATLLALTLMFAGYVLADGVLSLAAAFRGGITVAPRWWDCWASWPLSARC